MIYIGYQKITEERAIITTKHFKPELLSEDDIKNGVLVPSLPEEIYVEGKSPMYFINPLTSEVWIEYVDYKPLSTPLSQEQQMASLKEQISALNVAMAQMLGM
jgi:hypothetical protein